MARRQRDVETEVEQRDRDRGTKSSREKAKGWSCRSDDEAEVTTRKRQEWSTRRAPHAGPPCFHWEGEGLGMAGEVP